MPFEQPQPGQPSEDNENNSKGEEFYHQRTKQEETKGAISATKELNKFDGDIENKPKEQIGAWLQGLERIYDTDNQAKLERIKDSLHEKYVMDMEDIPESYWESQVKMAVEEGRGGDLERAGVDFETHYDDEGELHVGIDHIPEDKKRELAETIIDDQRESLDQWFDYLTSDDADAFPVWAKYWAFTGMTQLGTYDKETQSFDRRSENTVAPYPDLNREALALAVDHLVNKYSQEYLELQEEKSRLQNKLDRLDSYQRLAQSFEEKKRNLPEQALENIRENLRSYQEEFGEDTDFAQKEQELKSDLEDLKGEKQEILNTKDLSEETQEAFSTESFAKMYGKALAEAVPTEEKELARTDGKWVRFPQGVDPSTYVPEGFDKPLLDSIQGKGTGWCTAGKTTAENQLEGGDFCVYYSEDEVGDPNIPRVAIRMENNEIAEVRGIAEEQNLDPYITDVVDQKLNEFDEQGERYQKRLEDTERITEITQKHHAGEELTEEELRFLYEVDDRIKSFGYKDDPRIKQVLDQRNQRDDLSKIFDHPPEEISTTPEEALEGVSLHYGNLDLPLLEPDPEDFFPLPKRVMGDLRLNNVVDSKNIELPTIVEGNLDLSGLKYADKLKLPERIDGEVRFSNLERVQGLKFPELSEDQEYLANLSKKDHEKMTEIYRKCFAEGSESGEKTHLDPQLSIQDLRFIYEFDKKVKSLGGNNDPRQKEIISHRDAADDFQRIYSAKSNLTGDLKTMTEIYEKCFPRDIEGDREPAIDPQLTKEELRFLYEIDDEIEISEHPDKPRLHKILNQRNKHKDIGFVFGFEPEEVSLSSYEFSQRSSDIRFHYGSLGRTAGDHDIEEMPPELHVHGSINFRKDTLNKLPKQLYVTGSVTLGDSKIGEWPDKLYVGGDLYLRMSNIKEIPDNTYVGGDMDISRTEVATLPSSLHVEGSLKIRNTNISEIPDGIHVGGRIRGRPR